MRLIECQIEQRGGTRHVRITLTSMFFVCLLALGCVRFNGTWFDHGPRVLPDPNPPHIVTKPEFRFLVIEETADRPKLPASQQAIFSSVPLRQYLDAHCVKLADGSSGYRFCDKDQLDELPPDFRAVADGQIASNVNIGPQKTPWLYVSDGNKGCAGPLPASVDDLLAKIKPYAEGQ